jgi:hypothetical protein
VLTLVDITSAPLRKVHCNFPNALYIGFVSPAVQLTLFHQRVLKCLPIASKQASHLWKIFLDAWHSTCVQMLAVSLQMLLAVIAKCVGITPHFLFINSLNSGATIM